MPLKLIPPRPGKTPFYYVRGTHLGVYLDRSTKLVEKASARTLLRKWQADIERGAITAPGEPTFLDAIVGYLKAGGDPRFIGEYDEETGVWSGIAGKLGGLSLSAIDQPLIDETATELYPRGSASTRNRQVYTPISAVLKHAGVELKLTRPRGWRGSSRLFWLWPEQAFALFKGADAVDAEFGIFLRLLCYTGMRLSEACALRLADTRIAEGFAYLPDSKNGAPRAIFLPPVVVAALANHPRGLNRPGKTVFRFRKNGRVYELLDAAREASGVRFPKGAAFHTFCHTYGTWMRRYGGLDTDGLVETQRWKDRASAARYVHVEVSEASRKATLLPVENPWTDAKNGEKRA